MSTCSHCLKKARAPYFPNPLFMGSKKIYIWPMDYVCFKCHKLILKALKTMSEQLAIREEVGYENI